MPDSAIVPASDARLAGHPAGLRRTFAIISHPDAGKTTLTEKLLTYALGRGLEYYDMPAVRTIVHDAAPSRYKLSSIILGITKSLPFEMRKTAPATALAAN